MPYSPRAGLCDCPCPCFHPLSCRELILLRKERVKDFSDLKLIVPYAVVSLCPVYPVLRSLSTVCSVITDLSFRHTGSFPAVHRRLGIKEALIHRDCIGAYVRLGKMCLFFYL